MRSHNTLLCTTQTEAAVYLVNHLYSKVSNCLKFKGGSLYLMDNNTSEYHEKVVDFLHLIIPIYRPKWPHAKHFKKQEELYKLL